MTYQQPTIEKRDKFIPKSSKINDNNYCCPCRMTTRHAISGNDYTCQRCGSVKNHK